MKSLLLDKIEELFELNDTLLEKMHELFYKANLSEELYDTSPINYNKEFLKHKRVVYKQILSYCNKSPNKAILEIIEVRVKQIQHRIDKLSEKNIGTALNISRELWYDVLIDLKRHMTK